MEEDLPAQWQLDRCRRIRDIFALNVFRERVESLERRYGKKLYVTWLIW